MSNNIKLFNRQDENEKNLYRPQIFHYKYNTCIEKSRSLEKYDPDTLKSLSNLMKSSKSVTMYLGRKCYFNSAVSKQEL